MSKVTAFLKRVDLSITHWMARYSVTLLRLSLGIIFLWFGVLKFFPGASPADDLATRTIARLTFGAVAPWLSLPLLATWEVVIGLGLLTRRFMRPTIGLLLLQMAGTVAPLFLFPDETWTRFPVAGTLEGQYIIKNLVLIAGALVVGATASGGLVTDRELVALYRSRARARPLRRPGALGAVAQIGVHVAARGQPQQRRGVRIASEQLGDPDQLGAQWQGDVGGQPVGDGLERAQVVVGERPVCAG